MSRGAATAARVVELALLFLGLTACSSLFPRVPAQPGPGELKADQVAPALAPDKARVYLMLGNWRTGPVVTPLRVGQWLINDRLVGQASSAETLVADLPAGGYRFAWQAPWLPQPGKGITREQLNLMLAPGQTLTLRASMVQIAGLTADDYRLQVEVSDRSRATDASRDLKLRLADTNGLVGTPYEAPAAAQTPATSSPAGSTTPGPSPSIDPAAQCRRSISERLRELNELQRQGLITPDEYTRKRQAILDCL